jgi:molybdopterin/thiamine biosynthesis adenylyltransferase
MAKYYVIGCGGIGGWLANALAKTLTEKDELILVDGDKLEKKNLDRQLFSKDDIGIHKCVAMADQLSYGARCNVSYKPQYLGEADEDGNHIEFDKSPDNWVLVGADNHPARALALEMCDVAGIRCISAANGYEDAEAFIYLPSWEGTPRDPRVYYPEILTDKTDDPLSPPCTGEVLKSTPQLAIANMCAASYAMWLLWFWREKANELLDLGDDDVVGTFPVHYSSTAGRVRVRTIEEMEDE